MRPLRLGTGRLLQNLKRSVDGAAQMQDHESEQCAPALSVCHKLSADVAAVAGVRGGLYQSPPTVVRPRHQVVVAADQPAVRQRLSCAQHVRHAASGRDSSSLRRRRRP